MFELLNSYLDFPYAKVIVTGLWSGYVVVLGGWIILQKREPIATLSWVITLSMLPFIGFVVYYLIGPMRIERQTLRRSRSTAMFMEHEAFKDVDRDAVELSRMILATTGLPPTTARNVRLLIDGGQKYPALLEAIASAQDHIHIEYYIFLGDETGTLILQALEARAREGVKVRLLIDALGSARLKRSALKPLMDAGGEVAWFHPTRWFRFWQKSWANLRTHRKIVVIDDMIGFVGGINVTDDEDERLHETAYRDLHVRVEGNIVRELQVVFLEDWAYATGQKPPHIRHPRPQRGDVLAQVVASGPDSTKEAIHRSFVSMIGNAKERVWLMTPYFVPSEAARMALTSAAYSGLDVRVMVPKESDSKLVTYAARSYFDELLEAGVKVYEYGPRLLHTKAILCDDETVMIGSANFDQRSFRLNFEVMILMQDAGVGAELADLFVHEMKSAPAVRNDRHRPLWSAQLPEAVARLLSPVL